MIDLHMHSEYSDGTSSVKEILQKAEEIKLDVISITDHESCDAYKELDNINVKEYYSGKIIPGIELKNYYKDRIIDIVAYNLNLDGLKEYLKVNYKDKTHEILQTKYLSHFYKQAEGYNLILSPMNTIEWDKNKDWASVVFYNELKKHPENEEKVPKDLWEDFSNFKKDYVYNRTNMFFLDKKDDFPTPEETVKKVHELGGKAFLAHAYEYKWVENKIDFLKELINKTNLDGVECYYGNFTEEQQETLIEFCKGNNLSMSGRNRLSWQKKSWSRNRNRKRKFTCSNRNFKYMEIINGGILMNLEINKATRQSYGEKLEELGEKNNNIVVFDADLSGATKTSIFGKKFPERFFNMGISEQDMFSTAAGMATFGKIPFVSTFAMFASR